MVIKKLTCSKVTLDQLLSEQIPSNIVKALGGKGTRKENNSSKDVLFTKADVSTSESAPIITSNFEEECDNQEPLPPLPKRTKVEPSDASKGPFLLSDLTANMADLTLNTASKKVKKSSDKVSQTYVIKKKTEPKHPAIQNSCLDKSALPLIEQLLLTLMEEVKGCEICGSIAHEIADCPKNLRNNRKPRVAIKQSEPTKKYSKESGPKVVFGDNSSGDTEGHGSVNCNGITFTKFCLQRLRDLFSMKKMKLSSFLLEAEMFMLLTCHLTIHTSMLVSMLKPHQVLVGNGTRDYLTSTSKPINNLSKFNLVSGLPSLTFLKDKNCSAYEKRKYHKATFKTKSSFSINKCMHLLYTDLFGHVKPQTISHNKYTLVIVDEYSRYTWVFYLKKKSDAADCIMSFIKQMENLNDTKVKKLRSDNGTEFRNHTLEAFCDEKGISQNFSLPCTPEIRNKTLIEATRTMLNSASLLKQFWGEAVNVACYTQNKYIIVKRHRKIAYEVFRGKAPDISYFHVFGCPMHIHNHRDYLVKFDEKTDDGSFLGYSLVAKAFRVFNIRRQEMEESFHVTLSEDDEAISQTSTEGDAINFNEVNSFPDDEFNEPRTSDIVYEVVHPESAVSLESTDLQEDDRDEPLIDDQPLPQINSPLADSVFGPLIPQDKWL
ncbi:retrovirus-related pol polyprotein from transposon TNT 1-94 [Tanacetum coccineum]